jgi:hypothetical protein
MKGDAIRKVERQVRRRHKTFFGILKKNICFYNIFNFIFDIIKRFFINR